jgi:hypothetical protein
MLCQIVLSSESLSHCSLPIKFLWLLKARGHKRISSWLSSGNFNLFVHHLRKFFIDCLLNVVYIYMDLVIDIWFLGSDSLLDKVKWVEVTPIGKWWYSWMSTQTINITSLVIIHVIGAFWTTVTCPTIWIIWMSSWWSLRGFSSNSLSRLLLLLLFWSSTF